MYIRRSEMLIQTLVSFDRTTSNFSNISNNVDFILEGVNEESTSFSSESDSVSDVTSTSDLALTQAIRVTAAFFWPDVDSNLPLAIWPFVGSSHILRGIWLWQNDSGFLKILKIFFFWASIVWHLEMFFSSASFRCPWPSIDDIQEIYFEAKE